MRTCVGPGSASGFSTSFSVPGATAATALYVLFMRRSPYMTGHLALTCKKGRWWRRPWLATAVPASRPPRLRDDACRREQDIEGRGDEAVERGAIVGHL